MHTHVFRHTSAAAILASLLAVPSLSAQAFLGLGELQPRFDSLRVAGVSNNAVVVGTAINSSNGDWEAARWTAPAGIQTLGVLPGDSPQRRQSWGDGISDDGSIIVGGSSSGAGYRAFRWSAGGGMAALGAQPGDGSHALGISGDGSVIVGGGTARYNDWANPERGALVWANGATTPADLGFGVINDASYDGSVRVGWAGGAVRWSADGTRMSLGPTIDPMLSSTAYAVSADGLTIVGANDGAVMWRNGVMTNLGSFGPRSRSLYAEDVSGDGGIVVGTSLTQIDEHTYTEEPFVWSARSGMLRLIDVIRSDPELAPQVAGWRLSGANAISSNGRYIAGVGSDPRGRPEAWLLDISGLKLVVVPEPATYAVGALMLLALVVWFRRRPLQL